MTSTAKDSLSEKQKNQTTQATEAVAFSLSQIDLFIDDNKITYVRKKSNNVVWNLNSRQFKDWLISVFYENKKVILRRNVIDEVISTLSGIARDKGDVRKVFVRVAVLGKRYFLDLC